MFYQLIRVFLKNGAFTHSVQYFKLEDYVSVDSMLTAVQARYHNILAADLGDAEITYNACYCIDNGGNFVKNMHEVFDRRPVPEPEPEEEAAAE